MTTHQPLSAEELERLWFSLRGYGVPEIWLDRLEATVAQLNISLETAVAGQAVLASLLEELHATVMGECRSLLNEDSGGNARLEVGITEALSNLPTAAASYVERLEKAEAERDEAVSRERLAQQFKQNALDWAESVEARITELTATQRTSPPCVPTPRQLHAREMSETEKSCAVCGRSWTWVGRDGECGGIGPTQRGACPATAALRKAEGG